MIVYLAFCRESKKGYVGQTIRSLDARWAQHLRDARAGSTLPIHCAIRKYGAGNFEVCILKRVDNLIDLNRLEEEQIREQGTLVPAGYNVEPGGSNHTLSMITREKISEANSGKKKSPEHIAKIRAALKGKSKPWLTGYRHSPEAIEKMRAAREGKKPNLGHHHSQITKDKMRTSRKT